MNAKLKALAAARSKRASAQPRKAPEGYRSLEHFLDSVREEVGRRAGSTVELARYLRVNESSVRKWIKREKIPTAGWCQRLDPDRLSAGTPSAALLHRPLPSPDRAVFSPPKATLPEAPNHPFHLIPL